VPAISAARVGWPHATRTSHADARWLPHAEGHRRAADGLIGLLRTTLPADQARTGLP
jgi:hypothetical protein